MVKKNGKRILALAMSACMIMGSAITTFAAEGDTSGTATGDAPIYSMDFLNVVVPTTVTVAFNPDQLEVTVGESTSTDQILSQAMGIINKSSKDKVVQVDFAVTDSNDKITFVSSADDITNAETNSYAVYLTAVPYTSYTVSDAAPTTATAATDLADVTVSGDAGTAAVIAGDGSLGLCLEKATYSQIAGSEVTLGTTTSNNVSDSYEITALGTSGIAAFTFTGAMNTNTSWDVLTGFVTIDVTYTFSDVTDSTMSYGVVDLNVAPVFSTGDAVGTITYTSGTGDDGLASITSITMVYNSKAYDGYNALGSYYDAATDVDGTITFDDAYLAFFSSSTTAEATVTYVTNNGETKTATVDVTISE